MKVVKPLTAHHEIYSYQFSNTHAAISLANYNARRGQGSSNIAINESASETGSAISMSTAGSKPSAG